jgi:hypothetical protein
MEGQRRLVHGHSSVQDTQSFEPKAAVALVNPVLFLALIRQFNFKIETV